MTTEHDDGQARADEALAWLDGLAGRTTTPTAAPASREGARLRQALLGPEAQASAPTDGWARVRAAAAGQGRAPAANANHLRPWRQAAAAALVLASGLLLWQQLPTDEGARLRGAPAPAAALWLTPTPEASGQALQADLVALGATVTVTRRDDGLRLHVAAPDAARAAVNARLADIEAALDARGQVDIAVRAAPARAP